MLKGTVRSLRSALRREPLRLTELGWGPGQQTIRAESNLEDLSVNAIKAPEFGPTSVCPSRLQDSLDPFELAKTREKKLEHIWNLAQSIFVLLTGSAIVTPQGLPPITLIPLATVYVTGSAAAGVQTTQGTVTQAEANKIVEESEVGTGGRTEESAEAGVKEARSLVEDGNVCGSKVVIKRTCSLHQQGQLRKCVWR